MASALSPRVERELRARLDGLARPVRLVYFAPPRAEGAGFEQRALLEAVAGASRKLALESHELPGAETAARHYGIDKLPATALIGERDFGLRFYGVTGGYTFSALVDAIVMASTGRTGLAPDIETAARAIDAPLHIEVLVSLRCPCCSEMVRLADQLALASEKVSADMVDVAEFPALGERYRDAGLPQTIRNGRPAFAGVLPPTAAAIAVLRTGDREAMTRLARHGGCRAARNPLEEECPHAPPASLWWEPAFAVAAPHHPPQVKGAADGEG